MALQKQGILLRIVRGGHQRSLDLKYIAMSLPEITP